MRMAFVFVMVLVTGAMLSGCGPASLGGSDGWSVEKISQITGLAVPECAAVSPETGDVFISNIDAPVKGADNRYNTDDHKGDDETDRHGRSGERHQVDEQNAQQASSERNRRCRPVIETLPVTDQ